MIDKAEAIRSLGYNFYGGEDTGFTFYDDSGNSLDNPPTEAEIDAELKRLQAEYDSQAYARKRKEEYPDLAEQLDLLWHAIDTGTLDDRDHRNKFYSTLKTVKTNNPKG